MKVLFQFDNLLNNEYLIRKFQVDPFNPTHLVLPYEVVQRENSIKNQYVQNEQNTRKQYHLILTKVLNEQNGKLWNYDSEFLLIRPYFPQERKKIQIKILVEKEEELKQKINELKGDNIFQISTQPYQADQAFEKLYLVAQNENAAKELFNKLKKEEIISSILMENVDHLQEFQTLLQQKKMQRYFESRQLKQTQFSSTQSESKDSFDPSNPDSKNYGTGFKSRSFVQSKPYRSSKPFTPNQPYQQKSFYVEKSKPIDPGYMLIRKNSLNKTPSQQFKSPRTFAKDTKDFPTLGNQLNNQVIR